MKIIIIAAAFILLIALTVFVFARNKTEHKNTGNKLLYDFSVENNSGDLVSLDQYKGKAVLIVNVASKCGFTKQYEGLQEIYQKYNNKGFEILAFPSNDFGGQEPGSNVEIKSFCSTNFGVTFPLFDKINVKGENKAPIYAWLTNNPQTGSGNILWNFEKFLIDKSGKVVERFRSTTTPNGSKMMQAIETQL